jgi:hypothetical protein
MAAFVGRIPLMFSNMWWGLLVRIGGSIPHIPNKDVRLRDVIIGAVESWSCCRIM